MEIKEFLKDVDLMAVNAITVSTELLNDGEKQVRVELRRSKVMPDRMPSPARSHVFQEVGAFCKFIERNTTPDTLILADVNNHAIVAVINDKAEKGFELVGLRPAEFPAFTMLKKMLDHEIRVKDLASLLMRNRRVLGENDEEGKQIALTMQQLTVATKIEACTGSGARAINGVMCTTEVTGGAGQELVDLPETVLAHVPLFVNRPEVRFEIDVTMVGTVQSEVYMIAEAPELEVLMYEEMQSIVKEIGELIGDQVSVGLGRLVTTEWTYNK